MTGGDFPTVLGFWVVAITLVALPMWGLTGALDKWRGHLPSFIRQATGYLCEGDTIRCPHCHEKVTLEAWPDDFHGGYALGATCPRCEWKISQF